MAFETHIPHINSYNIEMRKSLIDKTFFLDKINIKILVDYGCADGALGVYLETNFPEVTYVGYDISDEMIAIAKKNVPTGHFFNNYDELQEFLNESNGDTAVVLNSIIHEVYSYGSREDVDSFWNRIFNSNTYKYVVIRDMAVSRTASRQSDNLSVVKIKQEYDSNRLGEFEAQWGSINENWALTHFLLKYRYVENWSREVRENYLPVALEDLLQKPTSVYEPIYFEHYSLPFIRQKVQEDFGIDMQERTHVKLIYKVKNV